tara:strand:+ start:208 stop:1419 length:1212 start_codon:yes stop_codon:yes gene_type:complete
MISKLKLNNFLVGLIILSFSVSFSYFLGEGQRNILLICLMSFSPIIVMTTKEINKLDILLILFILMIIFFPFVIHPEKMRWSTVLYTVMFCISFIAYTKTLSRSSLSISRYQLIIKYLIYAYTTVLIIQQICVVTEIPIFNVSNYNSSFPWKLNSLTTEPSHSAVYITVLMYSFIITRESQLKQNYNIKKHFSHDRLIWSSYLWTILTMTSGTAYVYLFILLMKLINKKNTINLIFTFSFFIILTLFNLKPLSRAIDTAIAFTSFDTEIIIQADRNAAYRIVPSMNAIKTIDLGTIDGWFGKGIDYMKDDLVNQIPGTSEGGQIGSIFTFAVDYGIILFFVFCIFSVRICVDRNQFLSIVFFVFGVLLNSINSQMLWFVIIFLYTNKNIVNQKSNIKKSVIIK